MHACVTLPLVGTVIFHYLVATTVFFKKSSYVMQTIPPPQYVQVILGTPIPFDVTVKITDTEGTATSKLTNIIALSTFCGDCTILQEARITYLDHTMSHFLLIKPVFLCKICYMMMAL